MATSPSRHSAVAALGAVFGCSLTGPATIEVGRAHYNVAVQQTANEQLLLNLVRLKYQDTPFFLEVSEINTQFNFGLAAGGDLSLRPDAAGVWGAEVGASVQERPTVTYTPLQGKDFVTRLLEPIDLSDLLLLYNSGWGIDKILRVCVQRFNGVPNAPSASGPTPRKKPEFEAYLEVMWLLRGLQARGLIQLGGSEDGTGLALHVAPEARDGPELGQLAELLGLEPGLPSYALKRRLRPDGSGAIAVVTRSLMGSLFYLSQGVRAPEAHEKARRVVVTLDPDGSRFDWDDLVGDLFSVQPARLRPSDAYVRTRYRGSWFFIDDTDIDTKTTFTMLSQLFALQAGHTPASQTIRTIPVGP